jgi:hypothetical protein
VGEFLRTDPSSIVGTLSASLIKRFAGDHSQQLRAWTVQLDVLRQALQISSAAKDPVALWAILLEYPLLRLQRRLDVVLLCGHRVIVIEFKVGSAACPPKIVTSGGDETCRISSGSREALARMTDWCARIAVT